MNFSSRKKCLIIFLFTASIFVIGTNQPSEKITGNFQARYALTKSLIHSKDFTITEYKEYLGYDQAIYENEVYCAHSAGFSIIMVPVDLFFVLPTNFLSSLIFDKKLTFYEQGWLNRIISISLLSALSLLYLYKSILLYVPEKYAIHLYSSFTFATLIFPYSSYAVPDILSATLQFPIMHMMLNWNLKRNPSLIVKIFSAISIVFLPLIKPINALFCVAIFMISPFFGSIRKTVKIALLGFLSLSIMLALNLTPDGNIFTFAIKYFSPSGNGYFPNIEDATRTSFFNLDLITLTKLIDIFFDEGNGHFTFNSILLLGTIVFTSSKNITKPPIPIAVAILPLLFYTIFFMGFSGWAAGHDFGWRNGLPLIPPFILLTLISFRNFNAFYKFLFILFTIKGCYLNSLVSLSTSNMKPKHRGNELFWYMERDATSIAGYLFGNPAGAIFIIIAIILFTLVFNRIVKSNLNHTN